MLSSGALRTLLGDHKTPARVIPRTHANARAWFGLSSAAFIPTLMPDRCRAEAMRSDIWSASRWVMTISPSTRIGRSGLRKRPILVDGDIVITHRDADHMSLRIA